MRILFVHNRYRKAGGEDLAVELETALLLENGHDVETILFENDDLPASGGKWSALKNAVYNPQSAAKVTESIARFKPDVMHVHNLFFIASPSVLDAATNAGIPVLMTLHNYRLVCCNAIMLRNGKPCEICRQSKLPLAGIRYKCYRNSASASALVTAVTGIHKFRNTWQKKVAAYVALTHFAKSRMEKSSIQVPEERIHVLPNFVHDITKYRSGTTEGPVAGDSREPFFLFAGRLTMEKGLIPLVEAFQRMPDLPLLVAGDGPDRAAMENKAAGAANIRFLGAVPRDQLLHYMAQCRGLMFPSIWYEGLPYVILESFCAGTPVIASRLGAMESVIEDGINGLHFEAGNPADMVRAVRKFILSGMSLYDGARNTWKKQFGPEQHYAGLMKIYSSLSLK